MSGLAITLNTWSRGEWGPMWVWLGTPGATLWLGVIALIVIGVRAAGAAKDASEANARGRPEAGERVWKLVIASVLGGLLAVGVSDSLCARVLKPGFAQARPCVVFVTTVPKPLECGSGFAMPSAHASNTAALAVTLGSVPLAIVAGVVGVGRVVDGQHWPSDVIVGWGIGGFIGLMFRRLAEWVAA
ncbi:MAG: phosphatase PAP2 family protein [Myxococcales bacterium]|nr:phosphatase PAP2 family protein [Myxococcales bacterium]